jgi:hypothetical protein
MEPDSPFGVPSTYDREIQDEKNDLDGVRMFVTTSLINRCAPCIQQLRWMSALPCGCCQQLRITSGLPVISKKVVGVEAQIVSTMQTYQD